MEVVDWGETPYQAATEKQMHLVEQKHEALVFCSHPPVVTLGRATQQSDIEAWSGETIETSRGGRATYHGPSQQVVYPIINLNETKLFAQRDVHAYLRYLEHITVKTLQHFGVQAEARTVEQLDQEGNKLQLTGVWVGQRKIASIGIAVRKWMSYHGVAINLYQDANAFKGIKPCGFSVETMVSLEELTGKKVDRQDFQEVFAQAFLQNS